MGTHWIGPGSYGDILAVYTALQPPCLVAVNELDKVVNSIRAACPNTFIMGRIKVPGIPEGMDLTGNKEKDYATGYNRFLQHVPYFVGVRADCFSIANEWLSQDNPYLLVAGCSAIRGAMDAAHSLGYKLAFGDFNTGQPQLERKEILDAIRPMLEQGSEQGHVLVIHLYPINGDLKADKGRLVDRWVPVFEQYPKLKVIVGEYAPDVRGDGGELLMSTGDEVLGVWPQIVGAARFTRGAGWPEFQFDLQQYAAYLAAHP